MAAQHCSFVLLADFDIDRGAQLTYQFPQPLGTDEALLANLMLPDGAERQPEDWTIFFLNQTPFNTIAPALAPDIQHPDQTHGKFEDEPELLYVLNLVRTKRDKAVRRGAVVKAMAICTRHSFIEIFKPVLLMALDDYFTNPSQDCLARLFDAINSIDISRAPILTRYEKLILRTSERKDLFIEKFEELLKPNPPPEPPAKPSSSFKPGHATSDSAGSLNSFDEGIVLRKGKERKGPTSSLTSLQQQSQYSPSEGSFSLDGSAVWVGDESGLDQIPPGAQAPHPPGSNGSASIYGRKSTDASSSSSQQQLRREESGAVPSAVPNPAALKDTHFFPTMMYYNDHMIPIRLPLSTFPEEVGDYSLIQLIQTFSSPNTVISGPLHPHLHTSGSGTHPIILLFNALVTGKRIIFLGHHRPAGQVSSYVLSACALGSGCGTVFRGFIKRAFPYANLINREEWQSIPGYIAGVTNPIFEYVGDWDLLCDISSSRMVLSKDILISHPPTAVATSAAGLGRTATLKTEASLGSEEDMLRSNIPQADKRGEYKSDNDNLFMEDITSAISFHFGEAHVRARFAEYAWRFVRLAARYEEDILGINTTIGYPNSSYTDRSSEGPHLGSGICFADEAAGVRELSSNANRIEAFRRTETYQFYQADFAASRGTNPIQGFDVSHQLWRLRHAKRMSDGEIEMIMRSLSSSVQDYDQVTELLSLLPPHHNGLLPLSFGLFHQQEIIRDLTVDVFNELRAYSVGVYFLQALNHFQRYAYVRQAHARESRLNNKDPNQLSIPMPNYISRTPSNRSESSLTGG
ncbi:spindle pole body interacting protein [Cristinia sonorae]|uniref:Spindle pole body interacting protein n=1 Tax=Cristinia sonorae TaxID=1940300 RepID=A0A8K0UPI3_9AGAR|nr:spindle pole body interacting protein [Cristinia sonorae]